EDVGLAKEIGYVDEQVVEERVDFFALPLQQEEVLLQRLGFSHHHAAVQAARDGGLLILRKIDAALPAKQKQNPLQHGSVFGGGPVITFELQGPLANCHQFFGDA